MSSWGLPQSEFLMRLFSLRTVLTEEQCAVSCSAQSPAWMDSEEDEGGFSECRQGRGGGYCEGC